MPIRRTQDASPQALIRDTYYVAHHHLSPLPLAEDLPLAQLDEALYNIEDLREKPDLKEDPTLMLLRSNCMLELAISQGTTDAEASRYLTESRSELERIVSGDVSGTWLDARRILADWPVFEARVFTDLGPDAENIPRHARKTARDNLYALYDDTLSLQGTRHENMAHFISAIVVMRELLDREDLVLFSATCRESRSRDLNKALPEGSLHNSYIMIGGGKLITRVTAGRRMQSHKRGLSLSITNLLATAEQQQPNRSMPGSPSMRSSMVAELLRNEAELPEEKIRLLDTMSGAVAKAVIAAAETTGMDEADAECHGTAIDSEYAGQLKIRRP